MAESWRGRFSDGQSARSWSCEIRLEANGLAIDRGPEHDVEIWSYSRLQSLASHAKRNGRDAEFIIGLRDAPGAQLVIRDAGALERLGRIAPQLTAVGKRIRWLVPLTAIAGAIVVAIALIWHLDIKPARAIAGVLPDQVRQSIGRSVVAHFSAQGPLCDAPAGRQALDQLLTRLLQQEAGAELFEVTVIDLPFSNAFATAGGQMILSAKLLQEADTPDEVAGVLAHEVGHGVERHPDAGLVRSIGLAVLFEFFTGGTGMVGSLAMHALQSGYVRQDELVADRHALRLLKSAEISYRGLETFFVRLAKKHKKPAFQAFDLLRTHPYPDARLAVVRRSVPYRTRPALTATQWRALRAICKKPA